MSRVDVYQGDSREVLKALADASVDAVVTDPPYALVSIVQRFGADGAAPTRDGDVYSRSSAGFMGRRWDTGETAFAVEFWREVWRVLKPGAHVVAFGGTRTYHRLATAIEDAGFEIRDMVVDLVASDTHVRGFMESLSEAQRRAFVRCIDESQFGGMLAWVYGSGFPKSHDVAKGIDAYLGAGAAEFEGLGTALKPALEPIVLARKPLIGSVARNVLAHGCGALNIDACRIGEAGGTQAVNFARKPDGRLERWDEGARGARNEVASLDKGRWPANVIHDGSDEVLAGFPTEAGAFAPVRGTEPSNAVTNVYGERARVATHHHGDTGSAARFFYSAKAGGEDRLGSDHPTVKPLDVMAWLIRLVTPPGGVVLDPFAGTGTTGLAAQREGFDAILIEREEDHAADIRRRLAWTRGEAGLTQQEMLRGGLAKDPSKAMGGGETPLPLFGARQGESDV